MRKLLAFLIPLLAAPYCLAEPNDFGPIRESTPDKTAQLKAPCNGKMLDAHLDAAHIYYPDSGDANLVVTNEFYLIWWQGGYPKIIDMETGYPSDIQIQDINGDGISELLVRFATGGHTNALMIYAYKDCEISLLPGAKFGGDADAPVIEKEHVNGYPVITELNRDWASGNPASAPSIKTRYFWDGKSYQEMTAQHDEKN